MGELLASATGGDIVLHLGEQERSSLLNEVAHDLGGRALPQLFSQEGTVIQTQELGLAGETRPDHMPSNVAGSEMPHAKAITTDSYGNELGRDELVRRGAAADLAANLATTRKARRGLKGTAAAYRRGSTKVQKKNS